MLTVFGWLMLVAGVGIAVPALLAALASAGRHDEPGARAGSVAFLAGACVACCALPIAGIVSPLAGLGLSTATSLGALWVLARDKREPWDAVRAAAGIVRDTWRPARDLPADEVAALRKRKEAEAAELPEAVPGTVPPTVPPSGKGNPAVTMPPPPPPPEGQPQGGPPQGGMPAGSVADIFTAVNQMIMRAQAEGMPGKHRAVKMFADMHDYLSRAENEFARRMSEPDQHYPPRVWEPLAKAAAHSRASSLAFGESDQALTALAQTTLGDASVSPERTPHSNELNAFT